MARTRDDALREDLLERAVDYVCRHGLSDLSLRPLAKALGTSSSLLLYHFKSKDDLIAEIIGIGRARQQGTMARLDATSGLSTGAIGRMLWKEYSNPRYEPIVRLFFEVYALALQDRSRFPGFLKSSVAQWLTAIEESFPDAGSPQARARATTLLAAFRGFLLDLCATRDRKRIDEAVDQFFDLFEDAANMRGADAAS
ncbi:MAG TPA: TetR/AcrR family transcriptional regulator [Candidatus Baltobacteraceae bacterium]|nr:TetR/AcrR family transcriptional regulator [Candidatus Baltobacteraceae bacterium]